MSLRFIHVGMLLFLLLFSRSVVSDSLWCHGLQHIRLPCPSLSPGVCSDLCPLSRWCHPAISSSVIPFSSCPQSLQASESFPMSQLFAWGGQSTGVSASASFPPKKSPDRSFRMDWLDLLAVQGTLKSLLQHHSSKASILRCSAFFTVQFSHPYMTTGKTIALTRRTFVGKVMSLLFRNQANPYSRKIQLNNCKKTLQHFYPLLPYLLSLFGCGLKISPCSQWRILFLGSGKNRAELIFRELCLYVLSYRRS